MKAFKSKRRKSVKRGQADQKSVVVDVNNNRQISPKLIVILIVAVLVGLAIWFGYKYYRNRSQGTKLQPTVVCTSDSTDSLTTQAAVLLRPSETQKLKPIIEKIAALDGHDRDPNCLYPIIQYYVYTSDPAKAQEYYGKLEQVYSKKTKFSADYGSKITLETIKVQVDSTQQLQQQIKTNTKYFN